MLVKSASLCDDCFKTAEKECREQQNKPIAVLQCNSNIVSNNSQSPSTSIVINNKLPESTTSIEAAILPDDDGYCEIDEIRLPSITKSPSIRINDPRRQSAPAPLPPETKDCDDSSNKTDSLTETASIKSPTGSDVKKNNHDTSTSIEQTSIASRNSTSIASTSTNTTVSNKAVISEHIEVNQAYESLSQPLAELNLNDDDNTTLNNGAAKMKTTCDNLHLLDYSFAGTQIAVPSVPCHLISAYVASLNLHISQLLVRFFKTFICVSLKNEKI